MNAAGFDFGTSNSAIGIVGGNGARLAPVEGDATMLPSAVFFDFNDHDKPFYGRSAIDSYTAGNDGRLMRSLKTILSTSLINERTALSKRSILLTDVIAMFTRHMRSCAEEALGAPIEAVVHGRPVRFVEGDDAADRLAEDTLRAVAQKAGYSDISFVYEPIAAATQYEQSATREEIVLVADIGGGTSDFSIVRIGPERRGAEDRRGDILANTGVRVGGTDFDRNLSMNAVMPLLGLGSELVDKSLPMPRSTYADLAWWPTINLTYTSKALREANEVHRLAVEPQKTARLLTVLNKHLGHRIAFAVEGGKIALTDAERTAIALAFVEAGLEAPATRDEFEEAIERELMRLRISVWDCLALADLQDTDIDTVFMTGGSSLVPAVEAVVAQELTNASVRRGDDFLSVAMGLTLEAQKRYG
ncbi:MAG: Hsp70 family protein [Alphaproteobacteria bacterium]|nr:Hsp70 family protein [Alphaproteobacteria bacterium]